MEKSVKGGVFKRTRRTESAESIYLRAKKADANHKAFLAKKIPELFAAQTQRAEKQALVEQLKARVEYRLRGNLAAKQALAEALEEFEQKAGRN